MRKRDFDRGPLSMAPPDPSDRRPIYLIGIDDTDNLESRGTGHHARRLGAFLQTEAMAGLLDVTRHQLFVDPRIPYTSHNSSLCLRVRMAHNRLDDLKRTCCDYLLRESAEGSDAGICIGAWDAVSEAVENFGTSAKYEVLTLAQACDLAAAQNLYLEGLTGDHGGMIGALAGLGLRHSGNDGRVVWRHGIRQASGILSAGELLATTGIDAIRCADSGTEISAHDRIDVTPWPRPVMIAGEAVLFVQHEGDGIDKFAWRLVDKARSEDHERNHA